MSEANYCDSHLHVVADPAHPTLSAHRTYTPGVATLDAVRGLGAPFGVTRFVIVQPSFYGTDNSVTLEALDRLGANGRGVAVIDPAKTAPAELDGYARRGIRGLRLNLYSPLQGDPQGAPADRLASLAAVAKVMDWHLQVISPLGELVRHAEVIERAGVPVVIDHYGVPIGATPGGRDGARLLRLLAMPHVWVKLSAPYRASTNDLETHPHKGWLAAILAVAAERCVWGSDWPHTPRHVRHQSQPPLLPYRPIRYADTLEHFIDALPSRDLVSRILRDNPARLYRF